MSSPLPATPGPPLAPATKLSENHSQNSQLHHRPSDAATPAPAISIPVITNIAPSNDAITVAYGAYNHQGPIVAGGDYDGDMASIVWVYDGDTPATVHGTPATADADSKSSDIIMQPSSVRPGSGSSMIHITPDA